MTKRIEPDLFASLMKLSADQRSDILEFLGQTPLALKEGLRLASQNAASTDRLFTENTQK